MVVPAGAVYPSCTRRPTHGAQGASEGRREGARGGDRTTGEDPHRRAARGSGAQRGRDGAHTRARPGAAGRPQAVSVAPDYAAPLVGWRTWAAVERKGGLALRSMVYEGRWPPGEPLVATCRLLPRSRRLARLLWFEPHEAPDERCECGVYAASAPELALPYLSRLGLIRGARYALIGRVALWGRVIECERGWRGTFAYPTHLYLRYASRRKGADARALAGRLAIYGVPVEVVLAHTAEALLDYLAAEEGALSGAA